jgi:tellurite resistance protein TerC
MEFLFADWLGTPAWFWLVFAGLVVALTAFRPWRAAQGRPGDGHRRIAAADRLLHHHRPALRRLGLGRKGADFGMAWYTGFFIEKALSIDNVFVIGLIFGTFAIREVPVPRAAVGHHRRDRAARRDDRGGAALVSEAYWVLYLSPPS